MEILVLAAVGVLAGILLKSLARGSGLRARLGRGVTQIARARENVPLVVSGVVAQGDTILEGPLSGRDCVAYEVEVYEESTLGRNRLHHESRCVGFILRDRTGKLLVAAGSASLLDLRLTRRAFERVARDPLPPRAAELLLRPEVAERAGFLVAPFVLVERALLPGDQAMVAGVARWGVDPEPDGNSAAAGYREAPRTLHLSSAGPVSLIVTDEPID